MSDIVISTSNITKQYMKNTVVKSADISIKKGMICGLVGPNGAGKTTIMKMVGGLACQTKGEIKLFGNDGTKNVLNRVGCLIEQPALYPDMNAADHLKFYNKLVGITDNRNIDEILDMIGLKGNSKVTKKYSMGMKQRLAIGIALLGYPDFLLLDEPVSGLDPIVTKEMYALIEDLHKEGITIIMISHDIEAAKKYASHILHIGKNIFFGTKDEYIARKMDEEA